MILAGRDIQYYIEVKRLQFDPPLSPEQFQQNGIDLRLASERGVLREDTRGTYVETGMWATMMTGQVYLAHTVEVITMPDDLMAFVELRSTWARRGLIIPPTIVDAGFQGDLTLEIFCAGPSFPAPVGERFAHLVFARLTGPTEPYRGKYQGQRGVTPALPDPGVW